MAGQREALKLRPRWRNPAFEGMMMQPKFWAAGDGNGGYDIGQGDFTIASVRDIRREDGRKVAEAYREAMGKPFDPRAVAMLFRAAPEMLAALDKGVEAAQAVIGAWERGDLAGAVNWLQQWAEGEAIQAIAKARGES